MRTLATLVLCALSAALATAQENAQQRGRRVVEEALTALGGSKYLAIQNRVESGRVYSFYNERLSGLSVATIYDRYLSNVEPGKPGMEERQSFGKDERYGAVLLTPAEGYQISYRGARPVQEALLKRFRDSTVHNIFYILRMRLKEPGLVIESRGSDVIDNAPAERVDITDADNRTVSVAFHRTTKLPLQQTWFRRDPDTREKIEEKTFFAKYRDVGEGVMWPYSIVRERNGERIFEQYSEEVKINQPLNDSLFRISGQKVLPPAR